jgi:hypothetical protein
MPWHNPRCSELSQLEIAADVPAASGVYAIIEGDDYLFVGDSWNLQSRLMDLAIVLGPELGPVSVIYETCSDADRPTRRHSLNQEYVRRRPVTPLAAKCG